jgi:hypothetical protein
VSFNSCSIARVAPIASSSRRPLAHHLLRGLGVVPQRRILDARVQFVEPPKRAVPVEEPAKEVERGLYLVDMGLRFGAHWKSLLERHPGEGRDLRTKIRALHAEMPSGMTIR